MRNLLVLLLTLTMFSCNDDDNMNSQDAELIDFKIEGGDLSILKTVINTDLAKIYALSANEIAASQYPISLTPEISISSGAIITPASAASVTFSGPEDFVKYEITSEDGRKTKEYVFTIQDRQIPNADFEQWHEDIGMNSKPFSQPGKYLESSVWATANMGTSIYSIYGTSPMEIGSNTAIKIETVTTVALPLVAGALYTGKFNLQGALDDPTNPAAAAILGIPFVYKPKAVKFKYSFKSGEQMIHAVLKDPEDLFGGFDITEIEGKDKFGIEAILENRDGNAIVKVAELHLSNSEDQEALTEVVIPFEYLSDVEPTHFYISFSPSFDGGTFKGAVGSTLVIDDIELIYE